VRTIEDKMNLEKTARKYFQIFENKDVDSLSAMFHEDIVLKDWNIQAEGKESVLKANISIFESVESLNVCVDELHVSRWEGDKTVIAVLSITANGSDDILPVVDIIKFNSEEEIISITAFRGN
tara:strand:+ start:310 stop:678 length:369 start_codon:yes stop_codon:yes gene_type:complete